MEMQPGLDIRGLLWSDLDSGHIWRITMASTWRKRKGGYDTWHFCSNCQNWPTSNYEEKATKPTTGEFCNECQSKQKANNCR